MTGRRAVRAVAVASAVAFGCSVGVALPAGADATAREWRAEADSVCRDGNTALNALLSSAFPNGLPNPPSADDLRKLGQTVVPIFQAQHDLIADLERPPKLRKKIKRLLRTFQRGVDRIAEGTTSGAITTQEVDEALVPAAKQAKRLGLQVCGA